MSTDDEKTLKDLAPPKFLDRDEWSASEWFNHAASGRRPINPAWQRYRREVLDEHGLLGEEVEDDG